MEEVKIKYFGFYLNKKKYFRVYFVYLLVNILGFVYFSFNPLSQLPLFSGNYIAAYIHYFFLINVIYTIIEAQFFWNKFTKKQLETIQKLKSDLEEKNNDILSSIRYAKRIQKSLLPTDKYIDKVLSGHTTGVKNIEKTNNKNSAP